MAAIGIDLGTTYSCVAVYMNKHVEVIANDDSARTTPSVVAFVGDDELVGAAAKNEMDPENTIYDAKRLIGRGSNDPSVVKDAKNWPFTVVQENGKPPKYRVKERGKEKFYSPEQISGAVLKYVKQYAEGFVGGKVKDAVITVPAYFNSSQRAATVAAGQLAGLNVLRLINEPTAAAIAYAVKNGLPDKKKILVYDLGGGTFDVSILEMIGTEVKVLAVGGNNHLGGNDFDHRLFEHFKNVVKSKLKEDVTSNPRSKELLRSSCEALKRALTGRTTATIGIHALIKGKDFQEKDFKRATFEELCADLFSATIDCVKRTLEDAKLTPEKIDQVLLVGGSTRIPKIRQLLENIFASSKICQSTNPDEAVAEGAAYMAARLSGVPEMQTLTVSEVISLSIGSPDTYGLFIPIIERNSQIPITKTVPRINAYDLQTVLACNVYQGERKRCARNTMLCSVEVQFDEPKKYGMGKVELTRSIDDDGILKVDLRDTTTDRTTSVETNLYTNSFAKDDIDRVINDALEHKEDDEEFERRCLAARQLNHRQHAVLRAIEDKKFLPKSSVDLSETQAMVSADIQFLVCIRCEWTQCTVTLAEINALLEKIKEL